MVGALEQIPNDLADLLIERKKSGREDSNLRPPGPEPVESRLLKCEETRGLLMLLIETFARHPLQLVEPC